jgi:hypothetical protein
MFDLIASYMRCDACGFAGDFWHRPAERLRCRNVVRRKCPGAMVVVDDILSSVPMPLPPHDLPDGWTRGLLKDLGTIHLTKPHMVLYVKTGKFSGLPLWKVVHYGRDADLDTRPWKGHCAAAVEIAPRS